MQGLSIDLEQQLKLFRDLTHPYRKECQELPRYSKQVERFGKGEYGEIEAAIYYCFVRHFRPKRIVEVGSGISAAYALRAADADKSRSEPLHLTCVDPFPCDGLKRLAKHGSIVLIDKMVQETDLTIFTNLQANDILFIDSTHTVKLAGDVNHLVLEVLPLLSKGVLVQFHDIPWPMPCFAPLDDLTFGQEAALVQAFLAFNADFEILLNEWWVQLDHPEVMEKAFPIYDRARHKPSSLWIRRASF